MTKQLRRGGEGMNLAGANAEDVRKATATQRATLMRRVVACEKQASAMKAELEERRARLEADFRQRAAELEEAMAPVRAELARAQEVLYTVDLYLGRQHMELLRDGEPAAATEPITVRQRVLAADEESLALLGSGGVDARTMDAFTDWVATSMENTSRLLPEPRCVVAVVPSRQDRDAGDPWLNAQLSAANRQTYWLFRNGERLWMMVTDFVAGPVILPRRDEFLDFFAVKDWRGAKTGETLVPGSEQWLKAEQHADARKRHFMRIGMILQGVIDRTTVFQPLPADGINLLTAAQADLQQVRFINELDLALEDGRPSFRDWQLRLNSQLTVGMRIIGAFASRDFRDEYVEGDQWHRGYHSRLHPGNASYPSAGEIYRLEGRNSAGELVIRYHRTDEIERRNAPVPDQPGWVYPVTWGPATQRASCVVHPSDPWVIPVDLASIDDLEYYLHHREARRSYLTMVPVIRAALEAKRAERTADEPFRALLADTLAAEHQLDLDRVEQLLPDAIDRWKVRTRHHRALTGDAAHEAKALRGVRDEFAAALNTVPASRADDVLTTARVRFGDRLLAVLTRRNGTHLAVARPARPDPFDRGWVDTLAITKTGHGRAHQVDVALGARTLTSTTALWSAPDWTTWRPADPTIDVSGTELDEAVALLRRLHGDDRLVAITYAITAESSDRTRQRLYALTHTIGEYALTATSYSWKRTRTGLEWQRAGACRPDRYSGHVTVAGQTSLGDDAYWLEPGNPWWDNTDRPRLVWADRSAFARWQVDVAAHLDDEQDLRAARAAADSARRAWLDRHNAALAHHLDEQLHQAFLADYGQDAEDLWPNHRASVNTAPFLQAVNDQIHHHGWEHVAGRRVADLATGAVANEVTDYRYPTLDEGSSR